MGGSTQMNQHVETLNDRELLQTGGGVWAWGDFFEGVGYGLGVGCYATGHPLLCISSFSIGTILLVF